MKHRLPTAPWTQEDSGIILRGPRTPCRVALRGMGLAQDIRDADLMYDLMKGRKTFRESRRAYQRLRRYALSIGGSNTDWPE